MKKTLMVMASVAMFATSCQKKTEQKTETAGKPLSVQMAESEMTRVPRTTNLDFRTTPRWNYSTGVELYAFLQAAEKHNNKEIYDYAYSYVDTFVQPDGSILGYKAEEYNIDNVNSGKLLFSFYDQTHEERFKKATDVLRGQMKTHPRTKEGGYWHKQVYQHQMWLDGLYMGAPFVAEYGMRNGEDVAEDMARQFCIVGRHTYDDSTRLYRHGWDESKSTHWADPETGRSQHAWGRANGWYMMAMVDALQYIPEGTPSRDTVITRLQDLAEALLDVRDSETGMWYQVLDRPGQEGNFVESSCSAMFIYSMLKGARLGYLDAKYKETGAEAFEQFVKRFIKKNDDGTISVTDCCAVAGLGGKSMRDGSFNYYINEPIRDNDPKTIGPFVLACLEVGE